MSGWLHYCWCGKWGCYGYGVSMMRDKPGTWYCAEHRPKPGEEPPPPAIPSSTEHRTST